MVLRVKTIETQPRRSVLPRHFPGILKNRWTSCRHYRLILKTSGNGFSGKDSDELFRGGWGNLLIVKIFVIPFCQKMKWVFGHWYSYKTSTTFPDKVKMVKAWWAHGIVPSRAFPQAARARRSRDHLCTDSVRSKLPPLYIPVSPSPVSREASCDLWRSIGPSTMAVFKLRTSLWTHPLCPQR